MEVFEDKLASIVRHAVRMEVESVVKSFTQEASSLTVERTAPEVNLANGRCSELPECLNRPFPVKLFLQHNTYLTEIPASFFENMPVLQVLDMSNTSIKSLPSSILKLFKLRELFLRGCEMLMELPPEIGCLTNLKVLDLEGTELVSLPKEVGLLLQLEHLKFSLYKFADRHNGIERSIISRETVSKLSSLKELSINVDPGCDWWDAEVEAIISDLGKLGNLETLKLYFPTIELLHKFLQRRCVKRLEWDVVMPLIYPTLSNFSFIVGHHNDHIMSSIPHDLQDEFVKLEKCLKYVNGKGDMDAVIADALEHVDALFLDRHWTIHRLSVFDVEKMDKLKFCLIAECNEMKTIIENSGGEPILGSLHYLGIHYMKNLRSIWRGPIVDGSLSSLKILAIHTCPELSTIFNLRLLDNLVFLQELIVEDCPKVRSLVTQESSPFEHKEFLPRLKKISLLHLPKLHNISSGVWIAPRLEKMVVYDCPKLKNLHPLERCSGDIKEIKGESEWWDSNKSDWGSDQHDYLVRVFVPLEDDASDDELAESVQVSLIMSQNFMTRSPSLRIQALEPQPPSTLKLIFNKTLSPTIFTGTKIVDLENNPLQIIIVDTSGDQMVPASITSSIKVEIVVLDGDFPRGGGDKWSSEEFVKNIVRERTGRRPLLTGELNVTVRDGFGPVGDIEFTDNSSWIRCRKFRLGARVVGQGSNDQIVKIGEAMTEAFVVKDRRGESYKKHHPPSLEDEVWRLEKIGKDGVFHRKLSSQGINTVQDFLKLSIVDPSKLRKTLGFGMSEKTWEVTLNHARTCTMGTKIYIYRGPNHTIIMNPICQVIKAVINGQTYTNRDLTAINRAYIEGCIQEAYLNWNSVEEIDLPVNEPALLTQGNHMVDQTMVGSYQQHEFRTDGSMEEAYLNWNSVEEIDVPVNEPALLTQGNHMVDQTMVRSYQQHEFLTDGSMEGASGTKRR